MRGRTAVLTWVSIYWFSRAGPAASARIYYETRNSGERENPPMDIVVPTGVAYFPKELRVPPRRSVNTPPLPSQDRGTDEFVSILLQLGTDRGQRRVRVGA